MHVYYLTKLQKLFYFNVFISNTNFQNIYVYFTLLGYHSFCVDNFAMANPNKSSCKWEK